MVNDLVKNWPGRAKFVDDLVVVETIPRNSISVMDLVAREIQQYCMDQKMKLNPKKCKEMFVNFMTNPNILSRDLVVNGTQIESVDAYKLLGVMLGSNLKWNTHSLTTKQKRRVKGCMH